MSREDNREQAAKAKGKAKRIASRFVSFPDEIEWLACRMRDNRKLCSCNMCGNPRRSKSHRGKGKLTLQEIKALDAYLQEKDT